MYNFMGEVEVFTLKYGVVKRNYANVYLYGGCGELTIKYGVVKRNYSNVYLYAGGGGVYCKILCSKKRLPKCITG